MYILSGTYICEGHETAVSTLPPGNEWNGMVFYGTSAQRGYFVSKTVNWWIDLGSTALRHKQVTKRRCTMSENTMKYYGQEKWNGQKMIRNLRQGVRIQGDVEFHHSHPGSFVCPEYSSDTRNRHLTSSTDGRGAQSKLRKAYFLGLKNSVIHSSRQVSGLTNMMIIEAQQRTIHNGFTTATKQDRKNSSK